MFNKLKQSGRLHTTLLLVVLSGFCLSLAILRVILSDTFYFLTLNWNLFLAFLPWLVSSIIIMNPAIQKRIWMFLLLLAIWLLFFPNAPYILTDLFHLGIKTNMPVWYDFLLIFSYAWTGLVFGFISLMDIENLLEMKLGRIKVNLVVIFLLFLGSFGIYCGRYLRWNSWDVISKPIPLIYDISEHLVNPLSHPRTWGMTVLMGALLNMMYWSFKLLNTKTNRE
jgi:uncharacterized membrane protein